VFISALTVTAVFHLYLQISGLQYFYHIHNLENLNNNKRVKRVSDIKASVYPEKQTKSI